MEDQPRDREGLLDAVVDAIPGWQVLIVQFNEVVARRLGVSTSDLQCLFELSRHGASTPGMLAERVGLTTGSASRMVDRLLVAGLVTREADPADRRRAIVTATPEALARVAEHYDPLNERLRGQLAELTDEALGQMLQFIHGAEATTHELVRR